MLMRLIDDVLIDFVHNDIGIIFDCQRRNLFQLLHGKDLAAGIGRITDQNCLCALFKSILQDIGIIAEGRRNQRNKDRLATD